MQEQETITLLQQAIDLLTKATVILQNNSNKNQQKLPKKETDENNPSPPSGNTCGVCGVALSNPNHTLCYDHYLQKRERELTIEEA